MTSEARAQTGQAWLPEQRREPASAGPVVVGSAVGNITFQASQILGFVAGAAVVAIRDPHKTLAIDAGTFGLSALITGVGVRARPAPARDGAGRTSLWSAPTDGIRLVFGSRLLLTLLLFGWLAGFSWPRPLCGRCARRPGPARSAWPSQACMPSRGSASWPGAVAQLTGAPLAVGLAGLVGLTAATMLATNWTHLRTRLIQEQKAEATAAGT